MTALFLQFPGMPRNCRILCWLEFAAQCQKRPSAWRTLPWYSTTWPPALRAGTSTQPDCAAPRCWFWHGARDEVRIGAGLQCHWQPLPQPQTADRHHQPIPARFTASPGHRPRPYLWPDVGDVRPYPLFRRELPQGHRTGQAQHTAAGAAPPTTEYRRAAELAQRVDSRLYHRAFFMRRHTLTAFCPLAGQSQTRQKEYIYGIFQ